MLSKVQVFINNHRLSEERFLPIKDFEGRFWVSDFGRIVSFDHRKNTIKFLSTHLDSLGYYATQLRMKPFNRKCRVHQLVGEHFCEMIGTGLTWNHKDGIKTNNYYKNLEYVSYAENIAHAVKIGLHNLKGENHPFSKLTKENVLEMRRLRKNGLLYKDIGDKFGICRRQASDVVRGVNWGWLT